MVDLSKHLARAKQAIDKRNYDLALEITTECQEIDPANLDNYKLLVDAAKRRIREGGKKGMGLRLGFTKDPHRVLSGAVKGMAKNPDMKTFMAAGDAAVKLGDAGTKKMHDVAVFLYCEAKSTGLFNKDLLWNLGQAYYKQFEATKDQEPLDAAIATMAELHRGDSSHGDAARAVKSWEAMRSMAKRKSAADGDYRGQLADDKKANKAEIMNRIIRTKEDAQAVLAVLAEELQEKPEDKALWLKKGDVERRFAQFDKAEASYNKALAIDAHDFVITMRLGDLAITRQETALKQAHAAGQDITAMKQQLLSLKVSEFQKRAKAQPTEMKHRYNLALNLYQSGDIDTAAGEFQQAVKDPRYKRECHNYLGHCFAKKGLLDLAQKQFTDAIGMIEDTLSDEFKEATYNRGRVCEAKGDKEQAMADYTKLVEIDLGFKDAASRLSALQSG